MVSSIKDVKRTKSAEQWYSQYRWQLGWIEASWTGSKLTRLAFKDKPSKALVLADATNALTHAKLEKLLGDHLSAFFQGVQKPFAWKYFDLDRLTPFQHRVLRCCYEIRPGETMSYGQLARAVGSPGAARAVGTVMANNKFPFLIPCHRVVASGGGIGGYSARGGVSTKQWLLDRESGKKSWRD